MQIFIDLQKNSQNYVADPTLVLLQSSTACHMYCVISLTKDSFYFIKFFTSMTILIQ